MFRPQLAVFSLFLLVASVTVFGQNNSDKCNAQKVAGSYVALRPIFSGSGLGVLDQLTLGSDGTAYWFQSAAFDLLVTDGTFIPQVGSWQCSHGTLVVTTIGVNYSYNATLKDEVKATNSRVTQKLSVVDDDTLETVNRGFRTFPLTSDPLDPNGGTVVNSTAVFQYKRVKPIPSDIP